MTSKIRYSSAQQHRTKLKECFDYQGYLEIWENGEVRLLRRHRSAGTPEPAGNQRDIEFRFSGPTIKSMVALNNGVAMQALINTLSEDHSVEWNALGQRSTREITWPVIRFSFFQAWDI